MIGFDFQKYVFEIFSTSKITYIKKLVIQNKPLLIELSVYLYSKIGFAMERHGEKENNRLKLKHV